MSRSMPLTLLFLIIAMVTPVHGGTSLLNIAFNYAADPPVTELKAFDAAVVDPDHVPLPAAFGDGRTTLFAYVSVGEVLPSRTYAAEMRPAWLIGENRAWKSKIVDVSSTEWRQFFLDRVVEPLWQAGYRGFFLDTLDSYRLAAAKEDLPRMEEGLVAVIRAISERHPEARLILNRGFEVFDRVRRDVFAVAAESLFRNFNPVSGEYGTVSDSDRTWLLEKLNHVQQAGVQVIAIDYLPPGQRELMRETAARIREKGFTPWVADKDLASLGIGSIEVMPRVILGLYDGAEGEGDPFFTNLQRYAVMPLNYLGYVVKLHDLREPLPSGIMAGRYAGVVIWPNSDRSGERQGLGAWVRRLIGEGVPVVFLERFGIPLDAGFAATLGLETVPFTHLAPPVRIAHRDPLFGFEQQPLPRIDSFLPMRLSSGTPLLQLTTANGIVSDAAAITSWGGYVAGRYVVTQLMDGQTSWTLDPFAFFSKALRLPEMPVPDTTTENGLRLLLSHVDGDGFESSAEWPGGKLAAEELKVAILERYHVPVTISLITSTLAPDGLYPEKSPRLEAIARSILSLPWVEGASHSFSHPFRWKPDQGDTGVEAEKWHTVKVPGYQFNLDTEIAGSFEYINSRLMPAGKKARIFQWTGNCLPGEEALGLLYRNGYLNINGGSTLITTSNRTLTAVAPLGIWRGPWFQVFAPNQNENVYTGLWSGNFYGYSRILETFRLTETPRRLKPVNIYYHFYSATKESSLNALKTVYDWAEKQPLFGLFTSEYAEKVLDFNRTTVARDGSTWLIRNSGALRELRIPRAAGYPLLSPENNLAGYEEHGEQRYIHLGPGGEARVQLSPSPPSSPILKNAGGHLDRLGQSGGVLEITLRNVIPFDVTIGGSGCRVSGTSVSPLTSKAGEFSFRLPNGSHALAVTCR